jgi:hypothetical protein
MGICFLGTGSGKPNFARKNACTLWLQYRISTVFSPTEAVQAAKHYALMMPYFCSTFKHMR